jgi:hypothetical protein
MGAVKNGHMKWPYWVRVLIGVDQLCNTVAGRDPDTTISHHLGLEARYYGGAIPWRKPLDASLWRLLERIDPGHCERSIEEVRHECADLRGCQCRPTGRAD